MDIKVGDLLANIRKAVDDDIDSLALPSTASQSRGTLMRGVLREMRVTMNSDQSSSQSNVREEIETLRDRIRRKGEAVSLLGAPLKAPEKPAEPPLIEQKSKTPRGEFSGILTGRAAEPAPQQQFARPQFTKPQPPVLRPSLPEEDHFGGTYVAQEQYQDHAHHDAWAEEEQGYIEDYQEPAYEPQHYHDRAAQTQNYPLVPQQPILSAQAEAATESAFRHLSETILARATGDRGLEDMTREMLRGMIKQWLDANLPGLVEELVREEIERVARKGR